MKADLRRSAIILLVILLVIIFMYNVMSGLVKSTKTELVSFKSITSFDKPRLADALLIGVSKCGSTALMFFLNLNPKIKALVGEIEYLCDEENYAKGLGYYYDNLPKDVPDNHVIVERDGTCWRKDYAERVRSTYKSLNKDLKIVIVACDPVYRSQSWYLHGKNKPNSDYARFNTTFEDVALKNGVVNEGFDGTRAATYDVKFEEWLQYFDRQQIHVIDGDRLKTDPYYEIRRMESFLGVDHYVKREHFYFNKTKGHFCKRPRQDQIICMPSYKGRYHPELEPHVEKKLRDYFKPHNDRFEELTGQKFMWNKY